MSGAPYWVNMWPAWHVRDPLNGRTQHASRAAAEKQYSIIRQYGPPAYRIKVIPKSAERIAAEKAVRRWRAAYPEISAAWREIADRAG